MSDRALVECIEAAILRSLQTQGKSRRRIIEMEVSFTDIATDVIDAISRLRSDDPLSDDDKHQIVKLMTSRVEAMGEISLTRSMGAALSAMLSDPRYEVRRRR